MRVWTVILHMFGASQIRGSDGSSKSSQHLVVVGSDGDRGCTGGDDVTQTGDITMLCILLSSLSEGLLVLHFRETPTVIVVVVVI
jgi:hypothetical protein